MLATIVVLVGGALIWISATAPSPVARVRYVNDTLSRVVVTPCGRAQRCVLAPGDELLRAAPDDGAGLRVRDARTQRLRGCITYGVGDREVLVSDADLGAAC